MKRKYLKQNVYEAFQERMHFIFTEFENIYVSFSGGKDSGLLLNMTLDFQKRYYPHKRIGVFHQDFEAQYTITIEYIERTFRRLETEPMVDLYWVCLPMATRTCFSSYQVYWYPWDDTKEELWVRPMPQHPYVLNLHNNTITTYKYRMHQEDLAKQFNRWYRLSHGNNSTVCLLGLRTNESLHRYSGILNKKYGYKNQNWISKQFKEAYVASPLYDWSISDVWHANALFGYDYNKLYDLYYMAGLKPSQMRVASPFNDFAKDSLNLYRVIDPAVWTKLVGRVYDANFGAIYGKTKAMAYRKLSLPKGHTWETYTKFLLATLPKRLRDNYIKKFQTSLNFWHKKGGGLSEETIQELLERGYKIKRNGISTSTVRGYSRIIFLCKIPDHTDDIKSTKDIPSWKRMCYCILRNDYICRFMGFGLTREQQRLVDSLKKKYSKEIWQDET